MTCKHVAVLGWIAVVGLSAPCARADVVHFRTAAGSESSLLHHYTFEGATTAERQQDFAEGTSLALGGLTSLPRGDLTAFGLYVDNKTNSLRFDSFEIQAVPVPEPHAWLLLALGGAVLLPVRRGIRNAPRRA